MAEKVTKNEILNIEVSYWLLRAVKVHTQSRMLSLANLISDSLMLPVRNTFVFVILIFSSNSG